MTPIEQLAKEIFIADNWRSKNPEKLWEEQGAEHGQYAVTIAGSLIADGWTKREGGAA